MLDSTKPLRGRRLTWAEFEQLTGRKRPVFVAANDNRPQSQEQKRQAS